METGGNMRDFDIAGLEALAGREARSTPPDGFFPGARTARALRAALAGLSAGRDEGEAAEWLADNRYLIEREALGAARDFSGAGRLRAGREGALICEAAAALVSALSGRVDERAAGAYFAAYARETPLTLAELGLIGAAIRCALTLFIAREFDGAPRAEAVAAAIESLRALSGADLTELVEGCDLCGQILARDPAGVYASMDESSRALYRRRLAHLAKRDGISESACARRVLELAEAHAGDPRRSHVGWWLLAEPLGRPRRERTGALCALAVFITAALVSAAAGLVSGGLLTALLALLPALEIAKNGLDALLLRLIEPRVLPRLALEDGVPDEGRTVCAVSAVLASEKDGPALARRLETFRAASRGCGGNLVFALLADLPEAASERVRGDAAVIGSARAAVDGLNEKYSGGFYLLIRPRRENRRDGVWQPRERKRGALMALAGLMTGGESELECLSGDALRLRGARYILALDADTTLLPGAARELIGAMLHPLNRPEFDGKGRVISGRGLIHPRVSVELAAAERSRFSRTMAGPGGIDPYGSVCGEVWMDLTGRGGFAGKGIIDAGALVRCCSGLPDNLVLSHDAVEGALLRGGYMGSTELTDGFPASPAAWFKRQHRWVRGDWQNLAVMRRLRGRLALADRLKLLDSARRSLTPIACAAALVLAALMPEAGLLPAAAIAALSLCSGLPGAVLRALTRRSGREKHPGGALYGAALRLGQLVLRFVFLPWEAWTNLSAVCTALWRVHVSHRRLLQWQTSAQALPRGARAFISRLWPQLALGAALAAFSPEPAGKTLGLVWAAGALFASPLGADCALAPPLAADKRRFLLAECAKIWRFFDENCTAARGFLPPDNVQFQPPTGAAERTSPTNIGLAMASCLAAADLGLAERSRALELIEGMLSTCERLEKWRGHLYNWYDLTTLSPLEPRYVSTVDSGNLAAALTALAAGLIEYGRPDLAARAQALRRGMDFSALYVKRRRLFSIGCDAAKGELGRGCYDLLASEARLTAYYAVASGAAPARHWRQLSRALVGRDGYRGLASWTGTMFEYLMPELFLPLARGSLLWESARFCLYAQRRDVPSGLPWGQSESAFFSLDASLSYRYKAHGCASLALQRGMAADTVCAPYAAYLALAVSPNAAVRCLRRFAELDPGGKYGLWEAVDFTPRRCASASGESVRTVMAHHLGMSLIAAANCLLGNIMCRRFMSEPDMAAFAPLLAERSPEGAVTLRRRGFDRPQRPRERRAAVPGESFPCVRTSAPRVYPLSNGVYSLLVSSTGLSAAHCGGVLLYRGFESPLRGPAGIRLRFMGADLLPIPGAEDGLAFTLERRGGALRFTGEGARFASEALCAVSARDECELRAVEIRAREALRGELRLEFEPVLARDADFAAHPAYWRLGLTAETEDGALLLRRIPREGISGCWLCLAADRDCVFSANAYGEALGALSHPYVTARVPLSLAAGETARVRFSLAFAPTRATALETARCGLALGAAQCGDLVSVLAAVYSLPREAVDALPELAGRLCFPRVDGGGAPLGALWALGISGDLPLAVMPAGDAEKLSAAIARHALLRAAGVRAELAVLTSDGGDYSRPGHAALMRALASRSLEALLGARGGVFVTDDPEGACAASAAVLMDEGGALAPRRFPGFPSDAPAAEPRRGGHTEYSRRGCEFVFTVKGALPEKCWSLPMSNGRFGYLAADCGLGNMWLANAREERVNAWACDERAAFGPETLETVANGRTISLFAAEDGAAARVSFGPGWARWEKLGARVTAFVPPDIAARVLIIENAPGEIRWHTSLTLAGDASDAPYVTTSLERGILRARNARTGLECAAAFSRECSQWTCDEAAWFAREPGMECGAGLAPCFGAVFPGGEPLVIVLGAAPDAELAALADIDSARAALERTREGLERVCRVKSASPHEAVRRYLDGWAVYQALVCRLMARCSLYQSGGAYGFRDQLQDAANLLFLSPKYARERILDACAHQYAEGDVMHWWHPGGPDRGVRTRISDDLLWLPWAVCEYVEASGDRGILSELVRGLASPPLAEGERSRYEPAVPADTPASVLEHCAAAFRCVLRRGFGPHGLLKIGSGDWCDAFDAVSGESVWLTEFFAHTARRFVGYLDTRSAAALESAARRCLRGVEAAWDGEWYRRGYYADGSPLGSRESRGCKIDALAQAWAAFCGCDENRVDTALRSAVRALFDEDGGLARLFAPPFGDGTERAGYINGYGEGFRENGGQYTHAAVWLALACLKRGLRAEGERIMLGLLRRGEAYGAEPFVLAADVYSNPARRGEAGWSWYTGAAGWYLRAAREFWPDKSPNLAPDVTVSGDSSVTERQTSDTRRRP